MISFELSEIFCPPWGGPFERSDDEVGRAVPSRMISFELMLPLSVTGLRPAPPFPKEKSLLPVGVAADDFVHVVAEVG